MDIALCHESLKDFDEFDLNAWGIYRVDAGTLPDVVAKLDKLNQKALKLGCEPFRMVEGETFLEPIGKATMVRLQYVFLQAARPKLNGWELVATLQNLEGQVIVRSVPGVEQPADLNKRDPAVCEHCNMDRKRSDTFVLRHENGEVKQVGRQCLADFLGHKDPKAIMMWAQWLATAVGLLEGAAPGHDADGGSGGGGSRLINLHELLRYVAMAVRKWGWVSRAMANDRMTTSTVDEALHAMFPPKGTDRDKVPVPAAEDTTMAEETIAWAQGVNADSDYLHNLKVYADLGYVDWRGCGYAGSMVAAYLRATEHVLKRKALEADLKPAAERVWVGKERERVVLRVKLLYRPKAFDGNYGTTWLHTFCDAEGNSLVWWGSQWLKGADGMTQVEAGEWVEVKATVKKHEDYRPRDGGAGFKQTVLTRVAPAAKKAACNA